LDSDDKDDDFQLTISSSANPDSCRDTNPTHVPSRGNGVFSSSTTVSLPSLSSPPDALFQMSLSCFALFYLILPYSAIYDKKVN
jgi:hypothetical protein